MDFSLLARLAFSIFSFDSQNMRFFNVRRCAVSLVLIPFFISILITNRLFLLLDHILFPRFRRQLVAKPVFIISAPRSATTYLFHLLASQRESFTCFRLWEIIFAPSIIQKYIFSGIFFFDQNLGNPLRSVATWVEKGILGDFTKIHKLSLSFPEEDEALLLWNLSTIYLNFFFPDTPHFKEYAAFDELLPVKTRNRIMRFYAGCVKRHNYFYNRNGEKRFLSKNPAMMSKVKSLHQLYPDALIININRCPGKTIPSTVALNNAIYHIFTSKTTSEELDQKTASVLIGWYQMADRYLKKYYPSQTVILDFDKLVRGDDGTRDLLSQALGLESDLFLPEPLKSRNAEVNGNKYKVLDPDKLTEILAELPFLKNYCGERS